MVGPIVRANKVFLAGRGTPRPHRRRVCWPPVARRATSSRRCSRPNSAALASIPRPDWRKPRRRRRRLDRRRRPASGHPRTRPASASGPRRPRSSAAAGPIADRRSARRRRPSTLARSAAAKYFPSGDQARETMPAPSPENIRTRRQRAASQMRTQPSSPAEAKRRPSGLKARAATAPRGVAVSDAPGINGGRSRFGPVTLVVPPSGGTPPKGGTTSEAASGAGAAASAVQLRPPPGRRSKPSGQISKDCTFGGDKGLPGTYWRGCG